MYVKSFDFFLSSKSGTMNKSEVVTGTHELRFVNKVFHFFYCVILTGKCNLLFDKKYLFVNYVVCMVYVCVYMCESFFSVCSVFSSEAELTRVHLMAFVIMCLRRKQRRHNVLLLIMPMRVGYSILRNPKKIPPFFEISKSEKSFFLMTITSKWLRIFKKYLRQRCKFHMWFFGGEMFNSIISLDT